MNALKALHEQGQSPWLDFIRRSLLGPDLNRLIAEDGISGMTSNPTIFEKAIGHSDDYDAQFEALMQGEALSAAEIFERLSVQDIQGAADALRPVYDRTGGADGYISLEVSPYLALKTAETLAEARHLWQAVDRPNLMVKVPGTAAGIPAIEQLIGEGININVTLLFGIATYEKVAEAYIRGLERRAESHGDLSRIASVASFFVSRIDVAADKLIEEKLAAATADADKAKLQELLGKVAIANAKLAYKRYQEIFEGQRWQALAAKGARTQRMLWASTGTKNKAYSDVLYVEALIGPDTVDTMPPETMEAFRDHGKAARTLDRDLDAATATLKTLHEMGISLDDITQKLVDDGVQLFADAADKLYEAVEGKRRKFLAGRLTATSWKLPEALETAFHDTLESWRRDGKIRRLWARDASLWTGADEAHWLGWLDVLATGAKLAPAIVAMAAPLAEQGIADILLIGMGGSSLGPEVLVETFGKLPGKPRLHVIDSTDPQQIGDLEARLDLAKTLFIVSSKSGSTMEPNVLFAHFYESVAKRLGDAEAGKRFVAVTDPSSSLEKLAHEKGFRAIFPGDPTIGGRFSVLSAFGLVPAGAMGLDLDAFLASAAIMVHACGPEVPAAVNLGVQLGAILGEAGLQGRDKVTILSGPGLEDFGAWAEQLIAESTGKQGKGLIPVDGEKLGAASSYGSDRVFVRLALAGRPHPDEAKLDALTAAGHPVVRIELPTTLEIAQEFFRWEVAVAVAGSILGINTFNQPDVESAKAATCKLFEAFERSGKLEERAASFEVDGIGVYIEPGDTTLDLGAGATLDTVLAHHFARLHPGDYAAFLGYLPREAFTLAAFASMRERVRDRYKVATVVGFGPRFLHSTGQAYKGGPNTGVFLQVTADHKQDLAVPGHSYSFAVIEKAQAAGDLQVLAERGRRVLRLHLHDLKSGLATLQRAIEKLP